MWKSIKAGRDPLDFLTPNLPNVFLAVVPSASTAQIAQAVEAAIREEWKRIADAVWEFCAQARMTADEGGITESVRKERFERQGGEFLSISWKVTPWPETLNQALQAAETLPDGDAKKRIQAIVQAVTVDMPVEHRDQRYYFDKDAKTKLNNLGLAWSLLTDQCARELDAVRQVRAFNGWKAGGWTTAAFNNKDSLNGRDEAVAGGKEWCERAGKKGQPWSGLFKKEDFLGAATLIKRVWHLAYLNPVWRLNVTGDKDKGFPMPNTRSIAAHDPYGKDGADDNSDETDSSEKYFAVLAFDGDEIGKWMSGEKTPELRSQFADYSDSAERKGAVRYFEETKDTQGGARLAKVLKVRRPVSPSYHLQLSEALSNFALYCARPIVESFDGRLIYAGGDDVLAFVPADTALACADALQRAFRGEPGLENFITPVAKRLLKAHTEAKPQRKSPRWEPLAADERLVAGSGSASSGFLVRKDDMHPESPTRSLADQNGNPIPFIVPGPAATASVGIAIAHFKAPLQDVVRAAQSAEKRAKSALNRNAVAITLIKHSGETIEWGCQWQSGGLELYTLLAEARDEGIISAKFPYRFVELLSPYLTTSTGLSENGGQGVAPVPDFPVRDVIEAEFKHVLSRQVETRDKDQAREFREKAGTALVGYLDSLDSVRDKHEKPLAADTKLRAVIGLCQTVAFTQRISETSTAEKQTV